MFRLGRLYCTSRGVDLLAFLRKCNYLCTKNKIMKQLVVLIISSSPSLKNIAQNFKQVVLAESPYFHRFMVFLPQTWRIQEEFVGMEPTIAGSS